MNGRIDKDGKGYSEERRDERVARREERKASEQAKEDAERRASG